MPIIFEPSSKKSFLSSFGEGLAKSVPKAASEFLLDKKEKDELEEEDKALEAQGIKSRGIKNPKIREALLESHQKKEKAKLDKYEDDASYDKVEETFGKKFADIWKFSPVGGRTELIKVGLDAKMRGHNIEELLSGIEIPEESTGEEDNQLNQPNQIISTDDEVIEVPQMKNGHIDSNFKWPDFNKRPMGYTPKEWKEERSAWRKENAPVFQENKDKLKVNERDRLGTKKLIKLNNTGKVAEGLERLLINPETGDFYGVAQIAQIPSTEAQEWAKEIARFQNRAKDAFGSRVTNFDLQSYMKQFPGLLNSHQGRERILEMMDINNQLDNLYLTALEKTYNKYGLSGVPQEEADRLAKAMIQEETQRLENEFIGLDEENTKEASKPKPEKKAAVMDELPPAELQTGKNIRDTKTGAVYKSDGKEWKRIK